MRKIQKRTRVDSSGKTITFYVARYLGPDGREHSKVFNGRTKRHAEQWVESEQAKHPGDWVDPRAGRIKVKDWAPRWLDSVRATLKPKTEAGYESLLRSRVLPALAGFSVNAVRPSDVQRWIGDMQEEGLSPSRIHQAFVVTSQLFAAAVRDNLITRNPCGGVKVPPLVRREAAYFEPEVIERIASALAPPTDLLVRILGTLGLRFGEAAALRRRSVDLLRGRLRIESSLAEVRGRHVFGPTKTHARRDVPLPGTIAGELREHLEERVAADLNALVFAGPKGAPLRYSVFYHKVWQPTLLELRLPAVGLHVLRHSAAAALISDGASPKAVQTILGHCSAAFTLTVYGHIFEADLDDLAERIDSRLRRNTGSGRDRGGDDLASRRP